MTVHTLARIEANKRVPATFLEDAELVPPWPRTTCLLCIAGTYIGNARCALYALTRSPPPLDPDVVSDVSVEDDGVSDSDSDSDSD